MAKVKLRFKKTFVFNEKDNVNPDVLIYVNCYSYIDALEHCKRFITNLNDIYLVDCYVFTKSPPKRILQIPEPFEKVLFPFEIPF